MTKNIMIIIIVAGAIGVFALNRPTQTATPTETAATEETPERTQHYEAGEIADAKAALQTLKDEQAKIATILEAEKLEVAQLESIHQISYTLEAAIDKMIAEKAGPQDALEAVDEAVQAIHYASEKHEANKTRSWFPKLEAAIANIHSGSEASGEEEKTVYHIVIKNHQFTPVETRVPAGKKVKLIVDNQDPTPEEFESHDMSREKIIGGNRKATIFIGPLEPGKYHYFGEFNMDSANGYIIAE